MLIPRKPTSIVVLIVACAYSEIQLSISIIKSGELKVHNNRIDFMILNTNIYLPTNINICKHSIAQIQGQ